MKTVKEANHFNLWLATLCLFLTFLPLRQIFAQGFSDTYYYYPPVGKIYLERSTEKILVKFKPATSLTQRKAVLAKEKNIASLEKAVYQAPIDAYVLDLIGINKKTSVLPVLEKLLVSGDVEFASPFLTLSGENWQANTNQILVGLKHPSDLKLLRDFATSFHLTTPKQNEFDKNLYHLTLTKKTPGDALAVANKLFETGYFKYAEPDFFYLNLVSNTNDPLVGAQWSLDNTGSNTTPVGTADADMDVFEAWSTTTGSADIKIAVIDNGVDLVHPDLQGNLLPGFDATDMGSNGGQSGNDSHGNACAGIIAAVGNNNIGIAGVAYSCKIIPVRAFTGSGGSASRLVNSINWSWQNGADILSNSWGGGAPSAAMDDAINAAVTLGRNGLGCVVLFASGNNNSRVFYPASNQQTVAVGATSPCDERKNPVSCDGENWGGDYGIHLDVSAPGVKIQTLDVSGPAGYNAGDYKDDFNGTSSATPNAAGVAALILSANPNLTQAQVRAILEGTCDKTGGYVYEKDVSGQPNGSWSFDLGHGRVNAAKAVAAALSPNDIDLDGFALGDGDCDDFDPAIFPGAMEVCDGVDNNCDGNLDEGFDLDGDGYTTCAGDCDDTNPAVHPGITEVCNNLDDDCNGLTDDFPMAVTYSSTDIPHNISVSGIAVVTSTLEISAVVGLINDLDVSGLLISHSFLNDLEIELTSPEGTTVRLINHLCNDHDNLAINFDDASTNAYGSIPCPPSNNGTYQSYEALSAFNGEDPNGTWTLTVTDVFSGSGGVLDGWGLKISSPASLFFADGDGDGYGNPLISVGACQEGFVTNNLDCDDANPAINPGATEICNNGMDEDCDLLVDENCCAGGGIIYVNDDATGNNDGSSWQHAYTKLQDALSCINATQIWVAAGTYKPTPGTNRDSSFVMKNNLSIIGGFAGNEGPGYDLSLRNFVLNTSILSGEIGDLGMATDNSYTVVKNEGNGLDNTAILDGFTITAGNSNGGGSFPNSNARGGGMFNRGSSPMIVNCIFTGNAATHGAGMYNLTAAPVINNCTFSSNAANTNGGGMYNANSSASVLTACTFSGNSATNGGGIFNYAGSSPILNDCIFSGNSAASQGGAMVNNSYSSPDVSNCIFTGNSSGAGGGAVLNTEKSNPDLENCNFRENISDEGGAVKNISSAPFFTNCAFFDNTGAVFGGGIHNESFSAPLITNCTFSANTAPAGGGIFNESGSRPVIVNCILWNNSQEMDNAGGSAPVVTHSIILGGHAGLGNLDVDPLFVDAANGDLHLQTCSPAIDRGDDSANLSTTDLDGNPRKNDAISGGYQIDLGAYEFQGDLDLDNDGYSFCNDEDCNDDPNNGGAALNPGSSPVQTNIIYHTPNSVTVYWSNITGSTNYMMRYRQVGGNTWTEAISLRAWRRLYSLPTCTNFETQFKNYINGRWNCWSPVFYFTTTGCIAPKINEPIGNNAKQEWGMQVFPNPTSEILNIVLDENLLNQTATLTLRDQLGRELWTSKIQNQDTHLIQLNVREKGIPAGVYSLSLQSDFGVMTKQVVVCQ